MKPVNLYRYSLALFTLLPVVSLAAVPNAFTTGDAIVASEMNENFDDLDSRIADLESRVPGGQNTTVAVDCSGANAAALKNMTITANTAYTLTGMCEGPIEITVPDVKIQGDATGTKDDGILLPTGLVSNPFAALGIYGDFRTDLENLTISSTNYTDPASVSNWTVVASYIGHGARVEITDVDFVGGRESVTVYMGSRARFWGNVVIQDFGRRGIGSSGNSSVEFRDPITISGLVSSNETKVYGVQAGDSSYIGIRNGGTITPPDGPNIANPVNDRRAIQASSASAIWGDIGTGGTFNVTAGRVVSFGGSNVGMTGATIASQVKAFGAANIDLTDCTVQHEVRAESSGSVYLSNTTVTQSVRVKEGAAVYAENTSSLNGGLDVVQGAAANIDSSIVVGNVEVNLGSSLIAYSSTFSGGYQHAYRGGNITYYDATITLINAENLWAHDRGSIFFGQSGGTTTVSTAAPIHAGTFSTLDLSAGDLGGATVECSVRADQVFENGATNYVFDVGCI